MLLELIQKKNKFIDWFIPENNDIEFSELYVNRRFVEAVLVVFIASFSGFLLKFFGIRESFPSELAMLLCVIVLALYKKNINQIITGNLFLGCFYFALTFELLNIESEITTYFRWFIVLPMFSLLFINRNSTIFWSAIILLTNTVLYFVHFPQNTILGDAEHKLFFFSDTFIFYIVILLFVYIYYVSRTFIDAKLVNEQIEIKNKAADLLKMQQQLIEKNNDLKTYAHVVSHDLKSPIRGIRSFSELLNSSLKKKNLLDPQMEEQFNFIQENAIQMEELVTDILRYAELSNETFREFKERDLNDLLQQAIRSIPKQINEESIHVHKENLPLVKVLPTHTKQIFQNLLSNSIKFADQNRMLQIDIYEEDHEDYVLFKFQDNGIGIKPENLKEIFLPFRRFNSHSKYSGSGIGLANCAKVVKQHHGKIWAESELGMGSTISFTLSKKIPI